VAATPGTTRDVLEGTLEIAGVPVRLLDTAGLGDPGDAIEAEGMKRTRRAIAESDLAILAVDGSVAAVPDDELCKALAGRRVLTVRSKADLSAHPDACVSPTALAVSSTTGAGVLALLGELATQIGQIVGNDDEGQIVATLRQTEGLEDVVRALRAGALALGSLPLEVALVDLREALVATSTLLGREVGEAVLDRIFATFCVGK
jgi:tRNA modification GTPase